MEKDSTCLQIHEVELLSQHVLLFTTIEDNGVSGSSQSTKM